MADSPAFRPTIGDPDATLQDDPPESDLDPALMDDAGWDIGLGFRITFGEDFTFADGRGLHVTVSAGTDFPKCGMDIRTVTPAQLRAHARHLTALAGRHEVRRRQATGWVRARFRADEGDPRPATVPAPGPWWCTGYGDGYSIVVAYLRPGQDIHEWWPEASDVDAQDVEQIVFTDRFPCPDWWDAGKGEARADA